MRSFISKLFYFLASIVLISGWSIGPVLAIIGALILFGIGAKISAPIARQEAKLKAYYAGLDRTEPFVGVSFDIAANPTFYSPSPPDAQINACAHRVARELSIEFLALKVRVVDEAEGKNQPRKLILDKKLKQRRKGPSDPLDVDEQRFWPTLQKLKIRCALEAAETGLPDVDPDWKKVPPEGTIKKEGLHRFMFHNRVSYYKGKLSIEREWEELPPMMFSPAPPDAASLRLTS